MTVSKSIAVLALVAITGAIAEERRFWHLTDLHLQTKYDEGSLVFRRCQTNGPLAGPAMGGLRGDTHDRTDATNDVFRAGKFGSNYCDSNEALLSSMMKFVAEKPADFIIWTGDNIMSDAGHISKITDEMVIDSTKDLSDMFDKYIPGVKVYPSLGNHDGLPYNTFKPGESDVYNTYAEIYSRWLDSDALETFKHGGYYAALAAPNMRVISINTILFDPNNSDVDKDTAGSWDQINFINTTLADCEKNGEQAILIGHIPPGINWDTYNPYLWWYDTYNDAFNKLVQRYHKTIVGQHWGHQHSDETRLFYCDGEPCNVGYLAPSVTPYNSLSRNPGIRLFSYDTSDDNALLNHYNYYFPLDTANLHASEEPKWVLQYTPLDAFDMKSLHPSEWASLVHDMDPRNSGENNYPLLTFNYVYKGTDNAYGGGNWFFTDGAVKIVCGVVGVDMDSYNTCMASNKKELELLKAGGQFHREKDTMTLADQRVE